MHKHAVGSWIISPVLGHGSLHVTSHFIGLNGLSAHWFALPWLFIYHVGISNFPSVNGVFHCPWNSKYQSSWVFSSWLCCMRSQNFRSESWNLNPEFTINKAALFINFEWKRCIALLISCVICFFFVSLNSCTKSTNGVFVLSHTNDHVVCFCM